MTDNRKYDLIIVGGGPAGLMAAISASRKSARILVLEKMDSPGRKLLATGGGRCNMTNLLPKDRLADSFGRHGRFIIPALNSLDPEGLRKFFENLEVPTVCTDGFHIFPRSQKASDVLQALLKKAKYLGVEIRSGAKVRNLLIEDSKIAGVVTDACEFRSGKVLLSTGGRSYPNLGSDGSGYALAKSAGHKIIAPVPALVELYCEEKWPGQCAGITFKNISLSLSRKDVSTGEFLFTHSGISGPAAMDISGRVSERLSMHSAVILNLNFFPGTEKNYWMVEFEKWHGHSGKKQVVNLLSEHLPKKIAAILCSLAGCPEDLESANFAKSQREKLAQFLVECPLTIKVTAGFDRAMVTKGGVSLKEVNPDTLESRITKGLYFAGEILDLDGPCGGYNLQWAFSSGHLAGGLNLETRR
ncbi:MAG TPA: NAD(P)/FAD-dependent oxidoreductase [Lentisphaeria bacterium]|nr:MAG: hypothetical protein A2X45_03530 [Lentisphaerae bacterium GWF2_50_93]HCE44159.1 NAD(P)/FAD-dependent oxidoreductase [Lentisphaeria bacterium]